MKLTKATYAATINLGNFESKRLELEYLLDEQDALETVRDAAHSHFKKEAQASNAKGSHYLS